ncbi:MAG: hypothetical protein RL662_1257 [Bacteroidota bacterium]|jgi:subfamily B ATP-binding cassette protein HlyB/CyaB
MKSVIDTQLKHNDCGISVIKTICNILDVDITRKYIEDTIFLDTEGSKLSDIKSFFDKNDFTTEYKLLDLNYAISSDSSYFEPFFPFILPINRDGGIHFVVVDGISKNKLKIFDPAEQKPYFLSLSEIRKVAYYSNSYVEYIGTKEKTGVLCNQILASYGIDVNDINTSFTFDTIYNKITYFLYIKQEYRLVDTEAEKKCLEDILFNQDIPLVPKHFKTLSYEGKQLKIKTPVILTVKSDIKQTVESTVIPEKEENMYLSLFKQLGKSKKIWYIYILIALFSATMSQLSVFINQILIDDILSKRNLSMVVLFAVGIALFKVFDLFTVLYKSWIGVKVAQILDQHFLTTFDNKLNSFSLSYIQGYKRGDLTERLSDSMKLKSFFLRFFTNILIDSFISIYTLGILMFINWQLTIVVIVVMILFYIWFRLVTPVLRQNERIRFIRKADFFSKMIEKLEGIQVLKSTHNEESYSKKIRKSIQDLLAIQVKTQHLNILNVAISSLITIAASIVIIVYLSEKSITENVITIGQIITFIALTQRIFSALGGVLDENLTLQENQVILKRFLDFREPPKPTITNGIRDFDLQTIEMQHVGFGYHPSDPILKDISISIEKGLKIKIEGRNGSGKSTLSKILSLLYEPVLGHISINGIDSKFYDQKALQEKILLVSNEDILFNDTFLYNLTFGKKCSTKRIVSLAKELQLYDFILQKEQGLEFMISENGKNLSTGQRKKILLLRALLHDAELIILDEVLAGIDTQSREEIEVCLNNTKDKTFIVISHEPMLMLQFDKTYRIVDGVLSLETL